MFNRHRVCRMWGGGLLLPAEPGLGEVWHSCPALHPDHRPDVVLPRLTPTEYHNTVNYLAI